MKAGIGNRSKKRGKKVSPEFTKLPFHFLEKEFCNKCYGVLVVDYYFFHLFFLLAALWCQNYFALFFSQRVRKGTSILLVVTTRGRSKTQENAKRQQIVGCTVAEAAWQEAGLGLEVTRRKICRNGKEKNINSSLDDDDDEQVLKERKKGRSFFLWREK